MGFSLLVGYIKCTFYAPHYTAFHSPDFFDNDYFSDIDLDCNLNNSTQLADTIATIF